MLTDWFTRRQPYLRNTPFVLAAPDHGRMKVTAANAAAQTHGIHAEMSVADARALFSSLLVLDDVPELPVKLLTALGHWCIRFTPITAIDPPDGLILDISGCPHLWGGEAPYLEDILSRLANFGYQVRAGMADTIGAAWAIARYSTTSPIIPPGEQMASLLSLPPAALRLETAVVDRLLKLGLYQVNNFIAMPRSALRRRFGQQILYRLDQALGHEEEAIMPLQPPEPFQERLPCMEPILTATGIEIALHQLLATLCQQLTKEGKGLRTCVLKCYRIDGNIQQIAIGTNRASHNPAHLFKLFDNKIATIEPALGIELFVLEATKTEDITPAQEALWVSHSGLESVIVAELLDRLTGKIGPGIIQRYLPDQHHWPERSIKLAASLEEKPTIHWRTDRPRPIRLLATPEMVEVSAPIPDYPPMLFRYRGEVHRIKKADGPERIEREWWLETGSHRDYYTVEDEAGNRYWIFRSGHYDADKPHRWFIHGFFA